MRLTPVLSIVLLLSLSAGLASADGMLSAKDRTAIEASTQAWAQAALAGDWTAVASLYTVDATLMPPFHPVATGRANIQSFLATLPPVGAFELKNTEVQGCGDLACVVGTYRLSFAVEGSDPIPDSGTFMEILHRQPDGSWLIAHDMYNSDIPQTP
jgi:uncharacterized protein (TIGR02246 family)